MKRIATALLSCLLALSLAAPVYAEDDTISSSTPGTASSDSSTASVSTAPTSDIIQNGDVYVTGYTVTTPAGGEVATVNWNDRVNIVIQVVDHSSARHAVNPEEIIARINSSVFTYTGVGEIGQFYRGNDDPDQHRVWAVRDGNASDAQKAEHAKYDYFSYVLLFRDVIYNGGGSTLPINLTYLDTSKPMQNFSVSIGQCVDKDPEDPSKVKSPSLVVRSSDYGTQTVTIGNAFPLHLGVYATSGTEALNDVVVSLTLPEGVTLTGGSLSSYVGKMSAGSLVDVNFSILPSSAMKTMVANITVNMNGVGAITGKAITGTTTISVPVSQPDRFEVGQITLPDTLYLGETGSIGLSYVNKGKTAVSNLEATLSGSNMGAGGYQYLGNLNAGTEGNVDFDVTPDAAGVVSGVITLNYESEDGTIHTVTKDFSVMAAEPEMPDFSDMDMPSEEPKSGLPAGAIAAIVVGALAVIGIGIGVILKRIKAKKIAALDDDMTDSEDSDEDL